MTAPPWRVFPVSMRRVATVALLVLVVLWVRGCVATPESSSGTSAAGEGSPEGAKAPGSIPADADGPFPVDHVVDGDTVWVRRDGSLVKIRLIGMDTPETVDPRKAVQCFGREASAQAKRLLTGAQVYLAGDATQARRDRYGRELDYLWLADGHFFNQIMIRQGFALEYTYDLPYRFQHAFRGAQQEAERQSQGLWAKSTCAGDVTQPAR
jgi:micrococcal nuclease